MKLTWHGTAAIELENEYGRLLFDPFVPLKHTHIPVTLSDFDGFTDILVTHGHLDHIGHLPEIIQRNPKTKIYCTQTPYQTLIRKGVPSVNLTEITFGQTLDIKGFCIHVMHGRHAVLPSVTVQRLTCALKSPARGNLPWIIKQNRICQENDETVFYQIEAEGKTISLMGSMNLRDHTDYPTDSDVLILPYNGWEDNFPPAIRMIERLKPKRVLLDHYDNTFPPVTTPLDLSPILAYKGVPVIPLKWNIPEKL